MKHLKLFESLFKKSVVAKNMPKFYIFSEEEVNDILDAFIDLSDEYSLQKFNGGVVSAAGDCYLVRVYSGKVSRVFDDYLKYKSTEEINRIQITILINKEFLEDIIYDIINFNQRIINMGYSSRVVPGGETSSHLSKYYHIDIKKTTKI